MVLKVEVFYIGFIFHSFKIQFSQTSQTYVVLRFFISVHVHGQSEHVMYHLLLANNVHEYKRNLTFKRTCKMPFFGKLSLQNVRSNFQRQRKKKIMGVSLSAGSLAIKFLNSCVCRN